jgi:hypothetical protein
MSYRMAALGPTIVSLPCSILCVRMIKTKIADYIGASNICRAPGTNSGVNPSTLGHDNGLAVRVQLQNERQIMAQ